ncbi:MAG: hypothetical protein KJO44_10090 [Gemmatimonadetes bacterium]|nr:hypothetical protein [Gemmatimonadota bacterium]
MASEPILELAELSEEPSADFDGRVQRSIERRSFAAELVGYFWLTPMRILLEYLGLVMSLGPGSHKERQDEE